MTKKLLAVLVAILSSVGSAFAHCPLCTVGAAAAAGGAAYLGVGKAVIGIFIGAFAVATGLWMDRLLKKRYIRHQKALMVAISFITTVVPLLWVLPDLYPIYISLAGEYGSLLNRTYIVNMFLVGSLIGALMVFISPAVSAKIAALRSGQRIPYQGMVLMFGLLLLAALAVHFGLKLFQVG